MSVAVFAPEMFLDEQGVDAGRRVEQFGDEGHFGDLFQYRRVVDRFVCVAAPCEGTVVLDQYARRVERVEAAEPLDDHGARLGFVVAVDLRVRHIARTGDGAVEIIGMGRSQRGDVESRLRPCRSVGRVGVYHAADPLEGAVERQVGRGVG